MPLGWLTSIAAVASIAAAAFTVGLAESGEPALPVLTFDGLAWVKKIFFLITEDTSMALQAFATIGERIDGQAGTMHTSVGTDAISKEK